jgi:hypothetical protein
VQILDYAIAVCICHAKVVFRIRVALIRGLTEPRHRLRKIPRYGVALCVKWPTFSAPLVVHL